MTKTFCDKCGQPARAGDFEARLQYRNNTNDELVVVVARLHVYVTDETVFRGVTEKPIDLCKECYLQLVAELQCTLDKATP